MTNYFITYETIHTILSLMLAICALGIIGFTIRINRNLKTKNPFNQKTYVIWLSGVISLLIVICLIVGFLFFYIPITTKVANSGGDLSPSVHAGGIKTILIFLLIGIFLFISSIACFILTEKHKSRRKLEWDDLENKY